MSSVPAIVGDLKGNVVMWKLDREWGHLFWYIQVINSCEGFCAEKVSLIMAVTIFDHCHSVLAFL